MTRTSRSVETSAKLRYSFFFVLTMMFYVCVCVSFNLCELLYPHVFEIFVFFLKFGLLPSLLKFDSVPSSYCNWVDALPFLNLLVCPLFLLSCNSSSCLISSPLIFCLKFLFLFCHRLLSSSCFFLFWSTSPSSSSSLSICLFVFLGHLSPSAVSL